MISLPSPYEPKRATLALEALGRTLRKEVRIVNER